MAKLVICRGCSGSGKTTWAKQQNGVVVERDAIRTMLYGTDGPEYYAEDKDVLRERENRVTVLRDGMIESALRRGIDVYVSDTNIEWRYVKALAKIAHRLGAEVEIKVFDVDLETAHRRNLTRASAGGRDVHYAVIRKQHSRFQGTKSKTLEPVFVPAPYEGTPGKPKAFLVDVDGTLAHMTGRAPYDWKRVGEDSVDDVIADIVYRLRFGSLHNDDYDLTCIVMSGRDGSCRAETEEWLNLYDVPFDHLFMREAGDMRPDNIIKAELFDTHVRDNFDVQFVIDDRWAVCEMWLRMGLKVLNVSGLDRGEF